MTSVPCNTHVSSHRNVSNNQITGTIPNAFTKTNSRLIYLDLSGNNFTCSSAPVIVAYDCNLGDIDCSLNCDQSIWSNNITACINPCANPDVVPVPIPSPTPTPTPTLTSIPTPTSTPTSVYLPSLPTLPPTESTVIISDTVLINTNYTINTTNNYVFPGGISLQNSTVIISSPTILFDNTVLLQNNSSLYFDYGTILVINGNLIATMNSVVNMNIDSSNNHSISGNLQVENSSTFVVNISSNLDTIDSLIVVNGSVILNGQMIILINQSLTSTIEVLHSNQQLDSNVISNIKVVSTSQGNCTSVPTLYVRQQSLYLSFENHPCTSSSFSLTDDQLMGIYIGVPVAGVLAITICLISLVPPIRRRIAPYSFRKYTS
eukprot:TRINITY_DN3099_c0_g1_i3.p1 TRINITY_DN3099_c0_g1~~TRINITY_DN3099_c0_g1_i3.p1  ORF type:complete len:376 (+),score=66.00 TRINITY_DN3099_c0_g1_i3:43-1170(+)